MPTREAILARSAALTETAEQRAARQVAAAYNQARRELLATLLENWTGSSVMTPDDAARLLRQSGLLQQIDARLLQLEREVGVTLRGIVTDSTERALDGMRRELALLPPDLRPRDLDMFGTINSRMVEQYVPLAMSDWHGLTVSMSTNLQRELQVGLIQGEAFPDLSRRLLAQAPGGGPGAVFPRAQTSADLATRRLVIAAENGAKQAAIAEVAQSIPLIQKQAIAAIGKNTTDCCLRVHGQIVDNDKPFELVGEPRFADELMTSPFHWNCRTSITMYHPFFEQAMPTAKLKADAARELKKREEEKSGKGKTRRGDTRTVTPTPAHATVRKVEPSAPAEPAFDFDDPVQVRQQVVEVGTRYDTQLKAAESTYEQLQGNLSSVYGHIERLEKNAEKRAGTSEAGRILAKLDERRAERDALLQKMFDTKAEIERLAVEGTRKVSDLLQVRDPARVTMDVTPGHDEKTLRNWGKGVNEFNQLVSAKVAPSAPVPFSDIPGRAHYDINSNTVRLRTNDAPSISVHELGHWLEEKNPDIHRKALDFFDRRTAGEASAPLRAGTPNEVGKKDKFLSEYMGREYILNGDRYATEIVSMGIQYLYDRPVLLAVKDPDYFDFIFNLVRGR